MAREIKEKEDLTKMIQGNGGLWTTEEVDENLEKLKTVKGKQTALKSQLSFRKKVLCQTHPDKTIFHFSHNKKLFSNDELKANLLKLLLSHEQQDSLANL